MSGPGGVVGELSAAVVGMDRAVHALQAREPGGLVDRVAVLLAVGQVEAHLQAVLDLVHGGDPRPVPQLAQRPDVVVHSGPSGPVLQALAGVAWHLCRAGQAFRVDCASASVGNFPGLLSETEKLIHGLHWILTLMTHGGVSDDALARLLGQR